MLFRIVREVLRLAEDTTILVVWFFFLGKNSFSFCVGTFVALRLQPERQQFPSINGELSKSYAATNHTHVPNQSVYRGVKTNFSLAV